MRPTKESLQPYEEHIERRGEIVYHSSDGRDLNLDIIVPSKATRAATGEANSQGQPLPVVFWIHGGGWGWRGIRGSYRELMQIPLAAAGYCAIGVEYRLSTEAEFPAQIVDIKRAIRYVRTHADDLGVDADRFGIWGRSAGGHLATLIGTSIGSSEFGVDLDQVQAVVSCFGPTDLSVILDELVPEREAPIRKISKIFLGGEIEDRLELVSLANPIRHLEDHGNADKTIPPFLFVHGRLDRSVPFSQSRLLHDRLVQTGAKSELIPVENANHGFLPASEGVEIKPGIDEIHRIIRAFFDDVLMGIKMDEK